MHISVLFQLKIYGIKMLSISCVISFIIIKTAASASEFPVFTLAKRDLNIYKIDIPHNSNSPLPDEVWSKVKTIGSLHQIFPSEYQRTTFKNEIKVAYDQNNIYIKAILFDDDMANISRNVMSKGQSIWQDDLFAVVLDPFNGKTNGYYFATNANGFKEEGLIANNNKYLGNWDGVWRVITTVKEQYWSVEMVIPFKTLSFDKDNTQWGINFLREVKQPEQIYYWTSHGNTPTPWAPEHAGNIAPIIGITQGAGLDIKLSASFTQQQTPLVKNSTTAEPSLDIVYKPTSAISTSLTINTDFSATEIDQQQINLSRFSLFTPEKRDFFLQGADIFEFGNIDTNGRPFFSRKMGLSALGIPLKINVGTKVTGQVDNTRFGLLAVNQELNHLSNKSNTLAVARVNHQFDYEYSLGLISTYGNPDNKEFNSLIGIDGQYRNKSLLNGELIEIKGWYQKTMTDEAENRINANAYNIGVYLPNEKINAKLAFTRIDKNFNPALGFINRNNIEKIDGWLSITNPFTVQWIDKLYHNAYFDHVTELGGDVSSKYYSLDLLDLTTKEQQYFLVTYQYTFEHIKEPFSLLGKLEVPIGKYNNTQWQLSTSSDNSKTVSYGFQWQNGTYFHGDIDGKIFDITTNFNRFIKLSVELGNTKIEFPEEKFTIKTASLKIDIAFSPELFWNNWVQFNNVDNEISLYSRLVWQRSPYNSFNFVINQHYFKKEDFLGHERFNKEYQDVIMKLSYMWRF